MTRQRLPLAAWGAIGAVLGLFLGVATAWFPSGPDHYEWTDAALAMGIAGLCVSAFAGLLVGVFRSEAAQGESVRADSQRTREPRLDMTTAEWRWRAAIGAVVLVGLAFVLGYLATAAFGTGMAPLVGAFMAVVGIAAATWWKGHRPPAH